MDKYISFGKYRDQFQFGLTFAIHEHTEKRHFHCWIELGFWYIEISIGAPY